MKRYFAFVLMLMVCGCAFPQSKLKTLYGRVDSLLSKRYNRITYDTLYVGRPNTKLTFKLRYNVSGNTFRYKNVGKGYNTHARLSTDTKGTISIGASYQGIGLSYSINPAKLSGRNKDYEFNVSISSKRYLLDLNYLRANTTSGNITSNDETYYLDKELMTLKMLSISGYYVFNHRRFSYPAAFTQSYFQKRSAGSWLAGFSFLGGTIATNEDAPDDFPDMYARMRCASLGGGYGYNLVWRKLLFHLSLMPSIVFFNYNRISLEDETKKEYTHFPDLQVGLRGAIIYNINPRYFIGSTLIVNSSTFGNFKHYSSHTRWYARAFFGFRL